MNKKVIWPLQGRTRALAWAIFLLGVLLGGVSLGAWPQFFSASPEHTAAPIVPAAIPPSSATTVAPAASPPVPVYERRCSQVSKNDNLSRLLGDYLSQGEILKLARICEPLYPVTGLRAGQPLSHLFVDKRWVGFIYEIDDRRQLEVLYRERQPQVEITEISYDVKNQIVAGEITESLYAAVAAAGEKDDLAWRLADIFAWDIDFIRDLRPGDRFRLLVEKRYREGKFAGYGRLSAAEFINQGELYRAAYFVDAQGEGYYDDKGRSLRKNFLKAPLDYRRISSGFSRRRFHPVLQIWRPHLAIDYAAPTGTPVWAVADGVISQRGYDKQSGNKLKLRHSNGYETVYIHLSRFANGCRRGSRVKQGQTIAYVGATGLATGPHLDFRVLKNGRPINPLNLKRTPTAPLTGERLAAFRQQTELLFADLQRSALTTAAAESPGAD
ncbi:MAG: M23 family metallopeptidase [Deltaproteobacteria bacterium]|nr:M23 family metallopeptidase [Deltaproteobacteria bacterium]